MADDRVVDLASLALWRTELRDEGHSLPPNFTTRPNPVLADDSVVCCLGRPGALYAADRKSGAVRWRVALDRYGASHACVEDGRVFAVSTHTLYAIDLDNGDICWRFSPYSEQGAWLSGGAVLFEDLVIVSDEKGVVHCLSQKTGESLWQSPASASSNPPATNTGRVVDDYFIAATNGRQAFALHVDSGDEAWRKDIDFGPIGDVQEHAGEAVVTTTRSVYFFDPASGDTKEGWRWRGEDVGGALMTPERAYVLTTKAWASKGPDTDDPAPTSGALSAYQGQDKLFERPYGAPHLSLTADEPNNVLYDCSPGSLGVLDAHTGDALATVTHADKPLVPGLISVGQDALFLLNGPEASLYALKHPLK